MLPAIIAKEQRIFQGSRKPVLEVICHLQCNQPLESLALLSRKLLDSGPYGNAFLTRVVVHPEFAFGFSYRMTSVMKAAEKEVLALCAEKDAVVIFNIAEGVHSPGMQLLKVKNHGCIASKGSLKKAEKAEVEATKIDVRRRAIEKNGLYIVSLLCHEATLELQNTRDDQIAIVPAYGVPVSQIGHNSGKGRAFIVSDLCVKKTCGAFREGDFWTKKTENGVTYFWLWE